MILKALIVIAGILLSRDVDASITLFSSPGCGPCAQAKQYMKQRGIAFEECNIVKPSCAKRFTAYGTDGSTPLIIINGRKMEGWSPSVFERERMRK